MWFFTLRRYWHLLALTVVIFLPAINPGTVAAHEAEAVYGQKCLACHTVKETKKISIKERSAIKGPSLWFAGSKFKKEWLEKWIASPEPLLGVKWGTLEKGVYVHPKVDESEAVKIADYLMTLVDPRIKVDATAPLPKSRGKRRSVLGRARQLFEKHQGCYACHRYVNRRGQELGGFTGPSLVHADKRLNADWVYAFLKTPRSFYPNGTCPIPGEKAFNPYTDKNRASLATYIVNMSAK